MKVFTIVPFILFVLACNQMASEPMIDHVEMSFDAGGHDGGAEVGVGLPQLPLECWELGQDMTPPRSILECKRYNQIGIQCCELLAGDHTPETCDEEFPCECDSGIGCNCSCINSRQCMEYLSTWQNACLRQFRDSGVE